MSSTARGCYALVSDYTPKPLAEGRWEAHRRYLDLQYVVSGVERMGVAPASRMRECSYEADRDLAWLEGPGDFLTLGAGQFMILWPGDAHMPGIDAGVPGPVRKVVVKIAVAGGRTLSGRRRHRRPRDGSATEFFTAFGGSHRGTRTSAASPGASPADVPQEIQEIDEDRREGTSPR